MTVYDFKEQLKRGQGQERVIADFLRSRGWKVRMAEMADQKLGKDMWLEVSMFPGAISVEVKSDSLAHKTNNMFVETVSVGRYHGGEFRVEKRGWLYTTEAEYLIYHVVKSGAIMVFEPEALRRFVEERPGTYRSVDVRNRGYSGRGLLVPIADIAPFAVQLLNIGDDN